MRFLITNDDGIHAPGIAALAEAASRIGDTIVVAPDEHLSGCSHQATTHRPLRLTKLQENWHMLDGSPADCTRVGLTQSPEKIDFVLSGVNEGGNLGADVYLSGTVAAAREAVLLGVPAIAFSQYRRRGDIDWRQASRWTERVLARLIGKPNEPGVFWNVNFPHLTPDSLEPPLVFCGLDPHPLPVRYELLFGELHYRGSYHERLRLPGHDVQVCFDGGIAVTKLALPGAALDPALLE
jgi:5'-nucleotidase